MIRAEDNVMLESQKSINDKADASISTDTLHYLATSQGSGVTTSTSGWTTTVQTMTATNKYLWTYHTYTKANGTTVDTTPVIIGTYGKDGTNGVSVTKVEPQYYLSTSATSATGGSWQTTLAYEAGKYIWTREKVTYSSGNPTYSTAIYNSALTTAWINANNAYQIASNTEQHFWMTETGDDTGAHITEKTKEDFLADPTNGGGNLLARSNGITARDGLTELASFGASGIQVGKGDEAHIEMDYHSMQLKDRGSNTYFHVSDLRDSDGIAVVQNQWTANNNQTSFSTQMPILEVVSVTVNGTETTNYTVSRNYDIEFPSGKSAGDVVIATYKTQSVIAKAYTLGLRKNDSVVGALSHAEGWRTTASGTASHAEGFNATASGAEAHAEGSGTVASGGYSHAEGSDTVASGNFSHAGGMGTIAKGNAQTAIGRYNVKDTNSLFIIGMGYTDQTRSNAFSVSTTGQVFVNGTLVHTSDRRLKEHIAYLDEDADEFIRQLKPAHYIKDDKHHVGFYAQDVDEADKWDCMTGEMNGYMTLGYMELIAPLVAYCQHLEERIKKLEK